MSIVNFINDDTDIAIESSSNGVETRTYKLRGESEHLDTFEQIIGYLQYLGSIGHSTSFKVFLDGDGSARLKFTTEDGKDILNVNDNKEKITSKFKGDSHDIESFSFE